MLEYIAPLLLFVILFVGFGLSHRGQKSSGGCGSCSGTGNCSGKSECATKPGTSEPVSSSKSASHIPGSESKPQVH